MLNRFLLVLILINIITFELSAQAPVWTETQPAGPVSQSWMSSAMSGDALTILAGAAPGRLYITTNGGSL